MENCGDAHILLENLWHFDFLVERLDSYLYASRVSIDFELEKRELQELLRINFHLQTVYNKTYIIYIISINCKIPALVSDSKNQRIVLQELL